MTNQGSDDEADDSDSDDDAEEDEDETGTKGWGSKRKAFYDGAEYEEDTDEDAADAEEEEVKRLQEKRAQLLQTSDFGEDEETMAEAGSAAKKKKKTKTKKEAVSHGSLEDDADVEELSKGASLSAQPPSGGRIPSRSPYNGHTILIRHGDPAAEAWTARQISLRSATLTSWICW